MAEGLDGKVVVITGAGSGLGRAHALELARLGAAVVVNDIGSDVRGVGAATTVAGAVVEEIRAAGGRAAADTHDVTRPGAGEAILATALDAFGHLDAVVNNAGILRDRTLVNLEPIDWASVLAVHLTGTYEVTRAAARHWRELFRAGQEVDARVVCTTSASGLYGNIGQSNYAAAKAGIVGFVLTVSQELRKYGVMVNALSPGALTRMTEGLFGMTQAAEYDPANVSPAVAWLLGPAAANLTGAVLECEHGWVDFARPWRRGPRARAENGVWTLGTLSTVLASLLDEYRAEVEAER